MSRAQQEANSKSWFKLGQLISISKKANGKFRYKLAFLLSIALILFVALWLNAMAFANDAVALVTRLGKNAGALSSMLDCSRPMRFGDSYGGWSLCRPINEYFYKDAIVYSVGIGTNIKWDEGMINRFSTHHHGWDPTPTPLRFFTTRPVPHNYQFHPYGLGEVDGVVEMMLPVGNTDSFTTLEHSKTAQNNTLVKVHMLTVQSMMRMMQHDWLAVLKIDAEGIEFRVIDSWHSSNYSIPADQVLIEFHARYFAHEANYKEKVPRAVSQMADLGFDLIMKATLEYSFARRSVIAKRSNAILRVDTLH